MVPLSIRSMLALRAAGFMATSTLGESPGVRMSWSEMCTWNADTPFSVPAGARISAGKSGKVDMSLPSNALDVVKRSPVSCMPSPESPANRTMTWSSCSVVPDVTGYLVSFADAEWTLAPLTGPPFGLHRRTPHAGAPHTPSDISFGHQA